MSRKEKLQDRAVKYADGKIVTTPGAYSGLARGFEDGYRAALRDARRAWNNQPTFNTGAEAVLRFLRPLR